MSLFVLQTIIWTKLHQIQNRASVSFSDAGQFGYGNEITS